MKSVNLMLDFGKPEILAQYKPTEQSLEVIQGIIGSKGSTANHIIAPYGSGKSFSALVGITLLSDNHRFKPFILDRINGFGEDINGFEKSCEQNLVIIFTGYISNLSEEMCKQAGVPFLDDINETVNAIQKKYQAFSRIAIIWDEFGHHLETLVREGKQEDLLNVQIIAEWAVRRSSPIVTFTTLMHKNLGLYVSGATQEIHNIWKKIEGRFDTIRLEVSERDSYEMVADILQSRNGKSFKAIARRVKDAGLFKSLDLDTIETLLVSTAPLTPAALETLPLLNTRFAQNERTLYQFLQEIIVVPKRRDSPVGLDILYDFFAYSLANDTGAGGVYRRFIESETALSQITNSVQVQVIKAVFLLKLGNLSERINLSKKKLRVALVEGSELRSREVTTAIETLIKNKLLLYQHHTDDISIFYGTDYDLDKAISEEVRKLSLDMELASELEKLAFPEPYVAAEYNLKNSITRYALSKYVTCSQILDDHWVREQQKCLQFEDAVVLLVIDGTVKDFDKSKINIPSHWIIAFPQHKIDILPLFLELNAIKNLQKYDELIANVPLLELELKILRSSAEAAIREQLEVIRNPDKQRVNWLVNGTFYNFQEETTPDDILTDLFQTRFPDAPIIRNEQVVRRNVSSVTKSARKRCNLAVLERSGSPHLGLEGATSSDASLYRTVFENTGLYLQASSEWRWAKPQEIKDRNLSLIWSKIEQYFVSPSKQSKPFTNLVNELIIPPIGIREGLIPLLIAAGIKAFGHTIAIHVRLNGDLRYLDDIQPSTIEEICSEPEQYSLTVYPFKKHQLENLKALLNLFEKSDDTEEKDLIRSFYDSLVAWRSKLPPGALEAQNISKEAKEIQSLLYEIDFDPIAFLTNEYPSAIGGHPLTKRSVRKFKVVKQELEGITEKFFQSAIKVAKAIFSSKLPGQASLLEVAEAWASSIPQTVKNRNTFDHIANGVLKRSSQATKVPNGEKGYVEMLSVILLGKSPDEWQNSDLQFFKDKLLDVLNSIETNILNTSEYTSEFDTFLKSHLASTIDRYVSRFGEAKVEQLINEIYKERASE